MELAVAALIFSLKLAGRPGILPGHISSFVLTTSDRNITAAVTMAHTATGHVFR